MLQRRRPSPIELAASPASPAPSALETLLQKERGVVWAKASYPNNTATITYHPKLTSEISLVEFIESAGFKAHKEA